MSNQILSEQEAQRRESLSKIIEMGINPFPAELYPVTDYTEDITTFRRRKVGLFGWSNDEPADYGKSFICRTARHDGKNSTVY